MNTEKITTYQEIISKAFCILFYNNIKNRVIPSIIIINFQNYLE